MSNCINTQSLDRSYHIAYASNSYAFIALSSLSLITNAIDIIFYNLSARKKQRNKSSSIEKMLFFLAIIEELISVYWLINSVMLNNEKAIAEHCTTCRIIGLFGLFLYNMEWVMISSIIFQLKKIITNPVNGVLNADSKVRLYILIDLIVAVASTIIGAAFQVEGISPINTCFIQSTYDKSDSLTAAVWILISIPLLNIFFVIYHIYRIIFSKATQNDIEMLNLFSKYMLYISFYLLCSLFYIIIYFFDWILVIPTNEAFQWFIYIASLILCFNSIICFFIRYIQRYFRVDLFKKPLSKRKMKEYVYDLKDLANMPLMDNSDTEFKWLENKFMRDVFASISYCLTKNIIASKKKINDSSIDRNYCLETKSYTLTPNLIENDELVKDIIGKDDLIKNAEYLKVKVVEYAPKIFSLLRRIDNIDEIEMIYSLLPSKNQIGISKSQGRSGNFFINTDDHNYIIKTINYEDVELIREILLEQLAKHFKLSPSSLIGRIYGLFKIVLPNDEEVIMLLMRNVFGVFNEDNILCKFDLKGSKLNRKENVETNAIENLVMKDLNFSEIEHSLLLTQEYKDRLIQNCKKDAHMLSSLGIMDYSLLIVKLSFNKDEIVALFGPGHKKKIEHDAQKMLQEGDDTIANSKKFESINSNFFDNEELNSNKLGEIGYDINQLRFDLNKVSHLKKHMYPSLKYDIVYIAAIIDFFQLYNMRKNLETKFKLLKAVKEDISSIPPNEYMHRFINNLLKITNAEGLLKNNGNSLRNSI